MGLAGEAYNANADSFKGFDEGGVGVGILDKLLGRSGKNDTKAVPQGPCLHVSLVPHWDSVEDMGHEDKATSFICDACHQSFTPQVASALRRTEADRLNKKLDLEASKDA